MVFKDKIPSEQGIGETIYRRTIFVYNHHLWMDVAKLLAISGFIRTISTINLALQHLNIPI